MTQWARNYRKKGQRDYLAGKSHESFNARGEPRPLAAYTEWEIGWSTAKEEALAALRKTGVIKI